ncbi:unnamed protein product [Larinioides sclopetarius]|uniref:GPI-anchored protein n=1 Tax=Larinioides sclopetarius TaxID=280406 RepID=A0AAV1ZPQ2_9ARAC
MGCKTGKIYVGYLSLIMCFGLFPLSMASAHNVPQFIALAPGPVIIGSPSPPVEDCGKISTDDCLDDLQTFMRLTALPFTDDANELDRLCKQALNGYNCSSHLYKGNCLPVRQLEMMPIFISAAEIMFFTLCGDGHDTPGYMSDAFLSVSECIMENKAKMDCCAEDTGVSVMPVMHILEKSSKSLTEREIATCCPLSRYLQCTSRVISESCGEFAANVTYAYIWRAAGDQVQAVCEKMPNYPDPDAKTCPSPVPFCSGSQGLRTFHHLFATVILLSFLRFFSIQKILE